VKGTADDVVEGATEGLVEDAVEDVFQTDPRNQASPGHRPMPNAKNKDLTPMHDADRRSDNDYPKFSSRREMRNNNNHIDNFAA